MTVVTDGSTARGSPIWGSPFLSSSLSTWPWNLFHTNLSPTACGCSKISGTFFAPSIIAFDGRKN